ncbi:MAG: oxidoreductase, partial [Desulfovibrio sp.]|nr:oxidoreductase [Desulfovibrio sp.]
MTSSLFASDGFLPPLFAGMIILLFATIQAVLQRDNPRRLILWGALHDVGILFLAFSANNAVANAGIWLFVIFQAIARALALVSLSRFTPDNMDAPTLDNLQGAGYGNLAGALFVLGLLASVGGSPFLVPEGRGLIVKSVLYSSASGGVAALLLMAAATTVFVWLYVDAARRVMLTPRDGASTGGSSSGAALMLVLGLLVAVLGLGRDALTGIVCRGFAVQLSHGGVHSAYWFLYAGALVAGVLAWLGRGKAAGIAVTAFSVLAFSAAYTDAAPPPTRLFLLLITFIGLMVSIYSLGYIHGERQGWYWFFLPLTFASLAGIVSADGKEALYGYWELMTFASYFLVVHEGNRTAFSAGLKYYVMCAGGAFFMLPGLFLLEGLVGPAGNASLADPFWIQSAL